MVKFRRWFRFSLRSTVIAVVLFNIALAFWFQWTWQIESPIGCTLAEVGDAEAQERVLDVVLDSLKLPNYDESDLYLHEYFYFEVDSHASHPGDESRFVFNNFHNHFNLIWSRQVSSVRYSWEAPRQKHGPTTLYYQTGALGARENWRWGKLHGKYEIWYPTGELLLVGRHRDGSRVGQWQVWTKSGKLLVNAEYSELGHPEYFGKSQPTGVWRMHLDPVSEMGESLTNRKHPQATIDFNWEFENGVATLSKERRTGSGDNDRVIAEIATDMSYSRRSEDRTGQVRFEMNSRNNDMGWWCASYDSLGECVLNAEWRQNRELLSINGTPISDSENKLVHSLSDFATRQEGESKSLWTLFDEANGAGNVFVRRAVFANLGQEIISCDWHGPVPPLLIEFLARQHKYELVQKHGVLFLERRDAAANWSDKTNVDATFSALNSQQRQRLSIAIPAQNMWATIAFPETMQDFIVTAGSTVKIAAERNDDWEVRVPLPVRFPEKASYEQRIAILLEIFDCRCDLVDGQIVVRRRNEN